MDSFAGFGPSIVAFPIFFNARACQREPRVIGPSILASPASGLRLQSFQLDDRGDIFLGSLRANACRGLQPGAGVAPITAYEVPFAAIELRLAKLCLVGHRAAHSFERASVEIKINDRVWPIPRS